jgi:hypothetical protein
LSRQRGLFQEPKSQAKGEGLWRLQQGKKRKAPFGLGENQETRGTAAKEIVREVCALWFFGPKEKGSCSRAESFCFFSKKRGGSREGENGPGEKVPAEGDLFFFQGRGRGGLCLGNGEKMGLWFPKERGAAARRSRKSKGRGLAVRVEEGLGTVGPCPRLWGRRKSQKIPFVV